MKRNAKSGYDGRVHEINDPIPTVGHPAKVIIAFVHPHEELAHKVNPQKDACIRATNQRHYNRYVNPTPK